MNYKQLLYFVAQRSVASFSRNMEVHGVVPDVLDTVPPAVITVKFASGFDANLGNELTPTQVKDPPTIYFPAETDQLYTFSMIDPDAPSRKNKSLSEFIHWLIVNIPGNDIGKGEVLAEYVSSGPPPGTGLHRYIFLAYKQPGRISCDEKRLSRIQAKNREHFDMHNFAMKYNLGKPVAGNFFQGQYDDYVPDLFKLVCE